MTQRKEILYVSTLCSDQILSELFATSKRKPLLSIQKFHKLFALGFVNNGCNVNVLSAIPVNSSHKRIFWKRKLQYEMGITFMYPFFINIIILKQSLIFINTFLVALRWCVKNHKSGFIICDVLNISVSSAARLAGAITRTPVMAIVTDLPLILFKMHSHSRIDSLGNLSMRMGDFLIRKYDAYVFLTKAMNEVINKKKKPFVIMEGISEGDLNRHNAVSKDITRNILYSGGLYEKYGIIKLVDAFKRLDFDDIRLVFYGAGELESYLLNCMKQDDRISYFGMQPNQVVVEAQARATLLVNPRSSNEEYTKYSFPSKNIEYMASGTPLVTTALPGIPDEYYNYLYVFDDETTTGIYRTLKNLLSLSGEELISKGRSAKEFICTNKNGKVQSAKILKLIYALG